MSLPKVDDISAEKQAKSASNPAARRADSAAFREDDRRDRG